MTLEEADIANSRTLDSAPPAFRPPLHKPAAQKTVVGELRMLLIEIFGYTGVEVVAVAAAPVVVPAAVAATERPRIELLGWPLSACLVESCRIDFGFQLRFEVADLDVWEESQRWVHIADQRPVPVMEKRHRSVDSIAVEY